jgi:hypothetical protein
VISTPKTGVISATKTDTNTLDDVLRRVWRSRPPWHDIAACRGTTVNFFPERGENYDEAKALCETCDARAYCYSEGLKPENIRHGLWGGAAPRERRRARRSET